SAPESVDAAGCLMVNPELDFGSFRTQNVALLNTAQPRILTITSTDNQRLTLGVSLGSGQFVLVNPRIGLCNLNPGDSCALLLGFAPVCLGEQSVPLRIETDSGAAYDVRLHGVGVPNKLAFGGLPDSVTPGERYPVILNVDPAPNCGEQPSLSLSFSPAAPDGSSFD